MPNTAQTYRRSMAHDNTKANLLLIAFGFAFGAMIVSPVVFEYQAWRWLVCGTSGLTAFLCLIARHRVVRNAVAPPQDSRSPRRVLWPRVISGAGVVVIGGVVAMLLHEPGADRKFIRFLMGFLLTCGLLFCSTFAAVSRRVNDDKNT